MIQTWLAAVLIVFRALPFLSWQFGVSIIPPMARAKDEQTAAMAAAATAAELARRRILAVTEEELQRIVLDIHDGPVQKLFAAAMQLELLHARLDALQPSLPTSERDDFRTGLDRASNLLESSLQEIRLTLGAFRHSEFRSRSLITIVEDVINQHEALTGMGVEFGVEGNLPDVTLPVKIAAYRVLQEALSNVYRHAGVNRLAVHMSCDARSVMFEVIDTGKGFEPPPLQGPGGSEKEEHIGLRGMRERAELVGGTIHVASSPGRGTRIVVRLPADG